MEDNSIKISNDVIATVSALAAVEVDGVAGLRVKPINDQKNVLSKANITKGVKITQETDKLIIDMYVAVKYGATINTVASKIQQVVLEAIENMTGLLVEEVNVHITSVIIPVVKK